MAGAQNRLEGHPDHDRDAYGLIVELFKRLPVETARQVAQIAPRSSERAFGSNVTLPAGFPVTLLGYDRKRVKAILNVPPTAAGPVYVGLRADMADMSQLAAGGGFPIYPGQSHTIEAVIEVTGFSAAQVVVGRWVERDIGPSDNHAL